MRVHFIAIGGAVMHNLAVTLHRKGYRISGSDDEIFEPSRTRLAAHNLLPDKEGWFAERITPDIDTVVLGMHARADNPELIRAQELGLRIVSFPEYLYEQTRNKKRIVVAGSHGKTTTTAMVMHVLKHAGIKFDYMVGSAIDGYETMVGISEESEVAVFEGDEYLSSPVDRRPKFHLYIPDIAIINGIAWDHMNVFPTFENYLDQFRIFVSTIAPGGTLIYFADDPEVKKLAENADPALKKVAYRTHGYFQNKLGFYGASVSHVVPLKVFGEHNMQNLSAAREACLAIGISVDSFYDAIQSFEGTSRRLQKLAESDKAVVYLDFAHAPSKVKATVEAVAARYNNDRLVACLELHTYSSLNMAFLPQYKGSLDKASVAYVYFNPHAVEMKRLEKLSVTQVGDCFGGGNVKVFNDSDALLATVREASPEKTVYLFMSSGDFNGTDLVKLASELV